MMEQYIPFMMRLTDFFERTEMVLHQMKAHNPECAAVREKLLFILREGKEIHPADQASHTGRNSIPDVQDIFDSLRKIFVLLKCVENKSKPACHQLSLLLKDCIALIAQSIASQNALEMDRRRKMN